MLLTADEIYEMYSEPSSDAEMVAFARAVERAVLEKLCAGVEMPEPVAFGPYSDLFTADQLRAYGAAQRLKALEDAALMCENESCSCCWTEDATEMASHLQDQIRALKGEAA